MCCQMGWIGCAILQLAQKAIVRIQFFKIFLDSPHQVDMKNVVKFSKQFFGYFNTLETHCAISKTYISFYFLVWWNVQVWQLWPKSLDGWTVGRFFIFLLPRMWWEMQNKRYFFTTCTLPSPKCELIFWYT